VPLRIVILFTLLLASGCVPVTEPLSDVTKAEPDKRFLGKWNNSLVVDIPDVKDNPKGLMRAVWTRQNKKDSEELWFFVTKIGKDEYINLLVDERAWPDQGSFAKEGEFARWQKSRQCGYLIGKYKFMKDTLVIDAGSEDAFTDLMTRESFTGWKSNWRYRGLKYSSMPAGWMTKYLEKTGPAAIFDGKDLIEYKR
jgi:hypothetical protein